MIGVRNSHGSELGTLQLSYSNKNTKPSESGCGLVVKNEQVRSGL